MNVVAAAASLDQALDAQLASAPADVRISLTFRDQGGQICRTFTQAGASGLACRDKDKWQMRGMFAVPEGQGGNYRMAAGMDPNRANLVDSTMAGEAFDAAAEKAEGQWLVLIGSRSSETGSTLMAARGRKLTLPRYPACQPLGHFFFIGVPQR